MKRKFIKTTIENWEKELKELKISEAGYYFNRELSLRMLEDWQEDHNTQQAEIDKLKADQKELIDRLKKVNSFLRIIINNSFPHIINENSELITKIEQEDNQ